MMRLHQFNPRRVRTPRRWSNSAPRRGVSAVESALLLPICLVGLLALLDLALSVIQHNGLAECARRAARTAIVRGHQSTLVAPLGPATWSGSAEEQNPLTDSFRSLLVCMPADEVAVTAEWPDGGNREGDRVHVTLTYKHRSLVALLLGGEPWDLKATSTMRIVH
jgi:hypothetical protein